METASLGCRTDVLARRREGAEVGGRYAAHVAIGVDTQDPGAVDLAGFLAGEAIRLCRSAGFADAEGRVALARAPAPDGRRS